MTEPKLLGPTYHGDPSGAGTPITPAERKAAADLKMAANMLGTAAPQYRPKPNINWLAILAVAVCLQLLVSTCQLGLNWSLALTAARMANQGQEYTKGKNEMASLSHAYMRSRFGDKAGFDWFEFLKKKGEIR